MVEHRHAALLRMAADNADQKFECGDFDSPKPIQFVVTYPDYDWRPVAKPKKTIKRWLWGDEEGRASRNLYSEEEAKEILDEKSIIKLLWSETIFEVDDE